MSEKNKDNEKKPSKKSSPKGQESKKVSDGKPKMLVKKINMTQTGKPNDDETSEGLNPEVISAEDLNKDQEDTPDVNPEIKDEELENYLTLKQVTFCRYFVCGDIQFMGNGTRSYAKAYGYYDMCKADPLGLENGCIQMCQSASSRLLGNVMILRFIRYINKLSMPPEARDSELALMASQRTDMRVKIAAIKMIEEIQGRIGNLVNKKQNQKEGMLPKYQIIIKRKETEKKKSKTK